MKLEELSFQLKIPIHQLERWIILKEIPIKKISENKYSYNFKDLKEWGKKFNLEIESSNPDTNLISASSYCHSSLSSCHSCEGRNPEINLISAMKEGGFYYNLEGLTYEEVFNNLLKNFPQNKQSIILKELVEREKISPTVIPKTNIAIPHNKNPLNEHITQSLVLTAFLKNKVLFGEKVEIVFLLLSKTEEDHINLLSKLAYCIKNNDFKVLLNLKSSKEKILLKLQELS